MDEADGDESRLVCSESGWREQVWDASMLVCSGS